MLDHIDWQEAVHDPRFWAVRYGGRFPGVAQGDYESYFYDFYNLEVLEEDPLFGYVGEGDNPQVTGIDAGWRTLSIPFPEHYRWQIELATEDGKSAGIYHSIFHPDMDPTNILGYLSGQGYTKGFSLAAENESLPGLHWAELKQIETCLTHQHFKDFDVSAIVPLLYPVVWWTTFDELEDARQKLATAWQDLQVLDTLQANQWFDEIARVYDKGLILRIDDHREWIPSSKNPQLQGADLWVQTEEGWKTIGPTSVRYIEKDSRQFLPFFSMLERYS